MVSDDSGVVIGCALGAFLSLVQWIKDLLFGDDVKNFDLEKEAIKDKIKNKIENVFPSKCEDPMNTSFVNLTNRDLDEFDSRQSRSKITDVKIKRQRCIGGDNPGQVCSGDRQCPGGGICLGGLALSIGSAFEPRKDKIDAGAVADPGSPRTEAPLPLPPIKDWKGTLADDVTIAISDDVFNQLFSNMTRTGKLRDLDASSDRLREFMPADCDSISDGRCRGGDVDGSECEDATGCPNGECIPECDDTCMKKRARCHGWQNAGVEGKESCEDMYPRRICSADSAHAGDECTRGDGDSANSDCHACKAGTPKEGDSCGGLTADADCGRVCDGGLHDGDDCTLADGCGTCSAESGNAGVPCNRDLGCSTCVGGDNPGDDCTTNLDCRGGGECESGTCEGNDGMCRAIDGACDRTGTCEFSALRRHCKIGQFFGERLNMGFDQHVWFKPDITLGPKLFIDDDPDCSQGAAIDDPCRTDAVEVKLLLTNLQAFLILNRDGNVVDGEPVFDTGWENLHRLEKCSLSVDYDPETGTVTTAGDDAITDSECWLWKHSLKVVANLSLATDTGEDRESGRPRLKLNFEGINRQATGGFTVAGDTGTLDLDFFTRRAGRDRSLILLEGTLRDHTPRLAPEGLDIDNTVEFSGTCAGGDNDGASCDEDSMCDRKTPDGTDGMCVDNVRVIAIRTRPMPTCTVAGTCDSGPNVGGACTSTGECPDDGYQDYIGITGPLNSRQRTERDATCAAKVCVGGRKAGKLCSGNDDCGRRGMCADKVCVGGRRPQECIVDADCPAGEGPCADMVCDGGHYEGEACTNNAFCQQCPG